MVSPLIVDISDGIRHSYFVFRRIVIGHAYVLGAIASSSDQTSYLTTWSSARILLNKLAHIWADVSLPSFLLCTLL